MELEVKNKLMALSIKEAVARNRKFLSGCQSSIDGVVSWIVKDAIDNTTFINYLISEFTKGRPLVCVGVVFSYENIKMENPAITTKLTNMGNILIHYPFNIIKGVTPENFHIITRAVLDDLFEVFKTKFGFVCEWASSKHDTICLKLP